MKQISLIVSVALVLTLIPAGSAVAGPSIPVEEVLEILDITISSYVNPVQLTVEILNIGDRQVNVGGNFSYAHVCPGNGSLSGTMTPSIDCIQEDAIGQVVQSISLEPGESGTVTVEFPFSIAPGVDYIFFTQRGCTGSRGFRCDGYLHSFLGLDQ